MSTRSSFNRPRRCPGCGELAYPADLDTVVKRMPVEDRGGWLRNREVYFHDEVCLKRWEQTADAEPEPLFGEQLEAGFALLSLSESFVA